ncbi:hypothetical protein [Clostridium manihotivorum]|uniref:Uncharacterized protein n=1 Tax=Clostridium manihotivorum TaxID=2320868 RepID=A0A3R5QYD3_9CLOT|nr:hypothetical protein [Clostridium manihotivorum]QAA35160.1 hypothetical protein C1I91_27890 [Clostridium manihotivorum]
MLKYYLLRILKYAIIIFALFIIIIIIFGFDYNAKGFTQASLGQGWYMVFQYEKRRESFAINFGVLSIVIPIFAAIISDLMVRIFSRRMSRFKDVKAN